MMFSEDYVQSMVAARDAASLVSEVEQLRAVRERFADVPARTVRGRLGEARSARKGRRAAAAAVPSARPVARSGAVSEPAPDPVRSARAAEADELAGARR